MCWALVLLTFVLPGLSVMALIPLILEVPRETPWIFDLRMMGFHSQNRTLPTWGTNLGYYLEYLLCFTHPISSIIS